MIKVVAILGAGRSMTSGVAKGLHLAGFPMGTNLMEAGPGNPYGYYEDWPLVHLNDRLLAEEGLTWDEPGLISPLEHRVELASEYIDKRTLTHKGQWGMKDPRLVWTWPVWKQAFAGRGEIDLITIDVWREPILTAHSLAERDGGDVVEALKLTYLYHEQMTAHHAKNRLQTT